MSETAALALDSTKLMQAPVILIIEDDIADIELARVALADCRVAHELDALADGREALARIQAKPPFKDGPRPSLILLDLSVPAVDGLELLRVLKEQPETRAIPVVVFSGTDDAKVVHDVYAHYANAFIRKPSDLRRFTNALCMSAEYWLDHVMQADR